MGEDSLPILKVRFNLLAVYMIWTPTIHITQHIRLFLRLCL